MVAVDKSATYPTALSPVVEKIRELAARDVDKFIQCALQVVDSKGIARPFVYRWPQQRVAEIIKEEERQRKPLRLYILKSRQIGLSTMIAARLFVKTWALDNREALIFAQQEKRSEELLYRCKFFYTSLPPELQLALATDSKLGIGYADTRSLINVVSAKSMDVVRGGTKQDVQISELAICKNPKNLVKEIEQPVALEHGTGIIIETTGKRFGSEAHEIWLDSEKGRNHYRPIFLPWQDDPNSTYAFMGDKDRDLKLSEAFDYEPRLLERYKDKRLGLTAGNIYWAYNVLRNKCLGDWEFFLQDYPCTALEAWRASGVSYFGTENLNHIQVHEFPYVYKVFGVRCPVGQEFTSFDQLDTVEKIDENSDRPFFKIWAKPRTKDAEYAMASDSSEGLEDGNFSSTFVVDKYTLEMMCEFHGKVRPDEHAQIINSVGNIYNCAMAAPEVNPPGNLTLHELKRLSYGNLWRWKYIDDAKDGNSRKLGWQTNASSRPLMLGVAKRLVQDISKGQVLSRGIIKSQALLDEMATFVIDDEGRAAAAQGCQDDRVITWAILVMVCSWETYGSDKDILSLYKTNPEEPQPNLIDGSHQDGPDPMDVISRLEKSGQSQLLLPREGLIR